MSLLPFRLSANPSIEIANISRCLLVGINGMNLLAHSTENLERRNPGSDQDLRILRHHNCVRHKHRGLDGIAQAVIERIADDANDLKPTVAPFDREVKWRFFLVPAECEEQRNTPH